MCAATAGRHSCIQARLAPRAPSAKRLHGGGRGASGFQRLDRPDAEHDAATNRRLDCDRAAKGGLPAGPVRGGSPSRIRRGAAAGEVRKAACRADRRRSGTRWLPVPLAPWTAEK
ncbi:hypothetical protein MASR1M60_32510 [Rhodocyclaceae bacterium]